MKKYSPSSREPSQVGNDEHPPFPVNSHIAKWIKEEWGGETVWCLLPPDQPLRKSEPPDKYLEFATDPDLEHNLWTVKSGLTSHDINLGGGPHCFEDLQTGYPFTAQQLALEPDDDLVEECLHVLDSHGWSCPGCYGVAAHVRKAVVEHHGAEKIELLYKKNNYHADYIIQELASTILAKPLSRLWYAANLLSLYFVHKDEFRLGYLWAEYRNKKSYEHYAIQGIKASEGGRSRQGKYASHTPAVLANMKRLMDNGHSRERAAELTAEAGFGTSKGANVKLWKRHKPAKNNWDISVNVP
jgi:hypothetical protein